ncbi:MAG: hypothetical protein ACI9MB_001657, partial [Verrucomicrobiales bacterium]
TGQENAMAECRNPDRFQPGSFELRGCQEISHTKMRRNFSQHQGRFQR